ncbi:hypothetical protein [Actinoplanes utahensis]|uniref:Uncharacterized protein n=1 Tax=Actinoplanes utahensis TaxID=1869 RepID=A0A0A6USW1_ACTUT|nr:hypothetical protein [Actinoplanes utahensis]KHD77554.1 hypothetical protein MB27_10700 [Actinoplanes utahensis]GIF32727.1 hypothetical protein Aut01nite_57130 [Actinoplanes utahensis]
MTVSLTASITSLYDAFSRVPRPVALDYCACCFNPEEERAVLADVPLRSLPVEALRPYTANVIFNVGGPADLRYFLPRMLEIAAGDGFDRPDLEPLLNRMYHAGWHRWQPGERDAVRAFLTALWAEERNGDVLCAIGNAEDDLTPYLAAWLSALTDPATRPAEAAHLLTLLRDDYERGRKGPRLVNAFWDGRPDQHAQVLAWLAGPELQLALFAAFEVTDDEDTARILTDIDVLL